ncbi:MAG TPA: hypothetical protein VFR51_03565 [Pyrinomonadaceae bacterium]|nr:hypothetical protein [Pyrinomonadaceae bacterium]
MKLKLVQVLVLAIALLAWIPAPAQTQKLTSLTASAKGEGTITVTNPGVEERKRPLYSVVVTLRQNGDAEIVVITDMQLVARGRWTKPADLSQGIALKITGGTVANNAKGSGKLYLRPDGKTIDKLNFDATSTARSKVTVSFVAEKENTN